MWSFDFFGVKHRGLGTEERTTIYFFIGKDNDSRLVVVVEKQKEDRRVVDPDLWRRPGVTRCC